MLNIMGRVDPVIHQLHQPPTLPTCGCGGIRLETWSGPPAMGPPNKTQSARGQSTRNSPESCRSANSTA